MTDKSFSRKTIKTGSYEGSYMAGGAGATVIMVHCSSASHKQWLRVGIELAEQYRVIIPDLIGYGESTSWPEVRNTPAFCDIDYIDVLIDEAGGDVHLVGHSYGGMLCMEAAARSFASGHSPVKSMLVIEPVLFQLLRDTDHADWQEVSKIAGDTIKHARAGNIEEAADTYMGYWLGQDAWATSPDGFKQSVYSTLPKVADEFSGLFEPCQPKEHYAGISVPVTLACGGQTTRAAKSLIELLAALLPKAEVKYIEGAGHMSPFSHADHVNELIRQHLQ